MACRTRPPTGIDTAHAGCTGKCPATSGAYALGMSLRDVPHMVELPHATAVDWIVEGSVWVERVFDALRASHSVTGMSSHFADRPVPHHAFIPQSDALSTELWVTEAGTRFVAFAVGDREAVAADVPVWSDAVRTADEAIAAGHETFPWAAIIGSPTEYVHSGLALAGPAMIGGIALRDGGRALPAMHPSNPPMIGFELRGFSWPMIAEGQASGFDREHAMTNATRDLHAVCKVVSLVGGYPLTLRHAPQALPPGLLAIPEQDVRQPEWGPPLDSARWIRTPLAIPDWAEMAWELNRVSAGFSSALGAWYEGQLLQPAHPSMALIAFIATVEAIGNEMYPVTRCAKCGLITESGKRFRKTLRLVLSRKEMETLLPTLRLYDLRSRTAHRGELHGLETTFGSGPGNTWVFTWEEPWVFSTVLVGTLGNTVARLLRGIADGSLDVPATTFSRQAR